MSDLWRSFFRSVAPPTLFLIGLAVLWEGAVRVGLTPPSIAGPTTIADTLVKDRATIWHNLEPTLLTTSLGYLLGSGVAVAIGLCVYVIRWLEQPVLTAATVLSSIPMLALAPVLLIWLGVGLTMRVVLTAIVCAFPVLVTIVQGLMVVPRETSELFQSLAATDMQRFRLLALPNALPFLFLGLKIAAPLAVLGTLIGEWTGAEQGMGVYMIAAMFSLQADRLWSAVTIVSVLSALAYGYIALIERLTIAPELLDGEVGR
jgi:ABC-type nitrate/sulfonate/bicarbonate transport system permease component